MEQEINSQGEILENLIKRYITNYCVLVDIPVRIKRIVIIGSGSSYNAGLFGKYFFENICQVKTSVEYASEIANGNFFGFEKDTLYIALSQSGNSADINMAVEMIKDAGAQVLCITNNNESRLYRNSDIKIDIQAGKENAIAATKTFSATVLMLWIISIKIAQNKHIDITNETQNIYSIKDNIEHSMQNIDNLDVAVNFLSKQKGFSIIGIGSNYGLSKEAALKIKETSYINANAYPMGDFIHGHFAILNSQKTILTFVNQYTTEEEIALIKKINTTYKTKSVLLTDEYNDYDCDILIKIQKVQSRIVSILNMIIALQLLAMKVAIKLKRNVDHPKGLKKVVDK